MHQIGDRVGQPALGQTFMGRFGMLGFNIFDFVLLEIGVPTQEIPDVGIICIQPELMEPIGTGHVRSQPNRA